MTSPTATDTRSRWDAIAGGYDELLTPANMALAERALDFAGVDAGMRVLDVAAGSGALSIPAARRGAEVLATDISPEMVQRLALRAQSEGLSKLTAQVMDGHALDLAAESFDVAASQFGLMLFPELERGLQQMVRVTKRGGRLLIVAMGPPERIGFLNCFFAGIQAVLPGFTPPFDPPPPPFQLSDRELLQRYLENAGLSEVRVERADHEMEFRSGEHMYEWVTSSNPIGAGLVADLNEQQRATLRAALDEILRKRGGALPARVSNEVNLAAGRK